MQMWAPKGLEEVHHQRGGDSRGDHIDERHRKAAEKPAPGEAAARRPGRRSVESSQRDHLEILAAKRISVQAEENKKFIPGANTARIVERLDRAGDAVEEKPRDERYHRRKQQPAQCHYRERAPQRMKARRREDKAQLFQRCANPLSLS